MAVSLYGYDNATATGVGITQDNTTTQDFKLTQKSALTVSGTVTDDPGAGWPLYASIRITATGFLTTAFTNPVMGQYSVELLRNSSYTFHVSSPGYDTAVATVTTGTSPLTGQDCALTKSASCDAPGYEKSTVFFENFNSGVAPPALPTGWAQADISGTLGNWATNAGTVHPADGGTQSAPNLIYYNSYDADSGDSTRLYRTTGADLSGVSNVWLSCWMYHDSQYINNDYMKVQVSTNGGSVWDNASSSIFRYDGSDGWKQHTIDISAFAGAGKTDVRVAFLGISGYGNDMHIDDVTMYTGCTAAAGGLVAGTVYDLTTVMPLAGVRVKGGLSSVFSNSVGVYVLFSAAGMNDVTAIGPAGYDNVTEPVIVTNGEVTGQDFYLPLSTSTSSTTTTVVPTTTTTVASTTTTTAGEGSTTTTTVVPTTTTTTPGSVCAVRIVPGNLGWFQGEREKTRWLLAIGENGTQFTKGTTVAWSTDAIETVRKIVFFRRFMLIKVRMDGARLDKGDYEVSIGGCTGRITMMR